MEPGVLVAWFLRNQNISKKTDFIPYDKFRRSFNLNEKVVMRIDKKKEIEDATKNANELLKKFTSIKEVKME